MCVEGRGKILARNFDGVLVSRFDRWRPYFTFFAIENYAPELLWAAGKPPVILEWPRPSKSLRAFR